MIHSIVTETVASLDVLEREI